jgi:hypothetical protein
MWVGFMALLYSTLPPAGLPNSLTDETAGGCPVESAEGRVQRGLQSQRRRRGGFGGLIEAVQYRKSAGRLSCSSRSTTCRGLVDRGLPPDSCDLS